MAAVSIPLRGARMLTLAHDGPQAVIGILTIGFGGATAYTQLVFNAMAEPDQQ